MLLSPFSCGGTSLKELGITSSNKSEIVEEINAQLINHIIANKPKQLHALIAAAYQEPYFIQIKPVLTEWLPLAFKNNACKSAAFLLTYYGKDDTGSLIVTFHKYALEQADQHNVLIPFCCKVHLYLTKYSDLS